MFYRYLTHSERKLALEFMRVVVVVVVVVVVRVKTSLNKSTEKIIIDFFSSALRLLYAGKQNVLGQ